MISSEKNAPFLYRGFERALLQAAIERLASECNIEIEIETDRWSKDLRQ